MGSERKPTGKVKWFHIARGYGFIGRRYGPDVFVHADAVAASGLDTLRRGQLVEFDIVEDDPRGPKAANLRLLSSGRPDGHEASGEGKG